MEPARDFAQLQLQFVDQIQWRYELIRPLVLFAEGTPTQRAEDTHTHPDTVRTFLRRFRQEGMLGLLPTDIEVAPRPAPAECLRPYGRKWPGSKPSTTTFSIGKSSGLSSTSAATACIPRLQAALAAEPAGHPRRIGVG